MSRRVYIGSAYDIVIAPGVGTFENGKFIGSALDYYYHILYELAMIFEKDDTGTLEVYLDLTHGINFMPTLTYRAIKDLLQVLAMFKEKVKFQAVNSDPWTPQAEKLHVHVVEDVENQLPIPYNQKITQECRPLEPMDLGNDERRVLYQERLQLVRQVDHEELSAFIGSLYNGLSLAVYRFYPDVDRLKQIITESVACYGEYVEVDTQNGRLIVNKRVKFARDFRSYLMACLMASLLQQRKQVERKSEVSRDEMTLLFEKPLRFDERFNSRISHEIYKLKEVEDKITNDWKPYGTILHGAIGEIDKRNFIAHCGLEINSVELCKDNQGGLLLRYNEGKIKTVKKYCTFGLQ